MKVACSQKRKALEGKDSSMLDASSLLPPSQVTARAAVPMYTIFLREESSNSQLGKPGQKPLR